ncbi:MAG: hypothetical protein RBR43_05685 [Desulfuromonadaceae bacterium]|nr:hypothetical protein [Desulfuromonas sp.]MDY0185352.1 hypothetical protein [Desulfuromonadaceae bacterium]
MPNAALIPTPDAIPVAWGWFYVLLMLTFLLHLLVMNAMLGGGIIALLSSLRRSEQNTLLSKEFSYKWPYTIAIAVNLGVAPLLFIQVLYGQFIYSSSILMAAWWLSIIVMLILAYYGAYIYTFKFDTLGSLRSCMAGFSVALLLCIAFLFSNNMTLMLRPESWSVYFTNASGSFLNTADPTLIPRYLHFVIGAVAVAGLYLALIGHFNFVKSKANPQMLIEQGMRYFTIATAISVVLGLWFLIALPKNIMMLLMGGSAFGTVLLVLGLVLTFVALYLGHKRRVIKSSVVTLLLLVVMVLMRDLVRTGSLAPYFSLSDLQVIPEYSPLIFFLVIFAAGLALVAYMLRLALECRKEVK